MDTKLFAKIGAGAFAAAALTMAAFQLREEPVRAVPEIVDVTDADSDPLVEQLRLCNAMGEAALRDPVCQAAWAEKRRRFLGKAKQAAPPREMPSEASGLPTAAGSAPAGGQ